MRGKPTTSRNCSELNFNAMKLILAALLLFTALTPVFAQIDSINELSNALREGLKEKDQKEAALLSASSDTTSKKLLSNNITVIGARKGLSNIVAHGIFDYGKHPKEYKLVETSDGRRALTFKWTYMGRPYTETIVSVPSNIAEMGDTPDLWRVITKSMPDKDGQTSEERVYLKIQRGRDILQEERFGHTVISLNTHLRERELRQEQWRVINGDYAERSATHFKTVPLFMHDFFNTEVAGCQYIGEEKLANRNTYVIRRGAELFYYIDKEKFLLLQWGRNEVFGAGKLEVSYLASSFKRWSGPSGPLLLPSKVSVVAKGQTLGSYSVDRVEIDASPDPEIFTPPSF